MAVCGLWCKLRVGCTVACMVGCIPYGGLYCELKSGLLPVGWAMGSELSGMIKCNVRRTLILNTGMLFGGLSLLCVYTSTPLLAHSCRL